MASEELVTVEAEIAALEQKLALLKIKRVELQGAGSGKMKYKAKTWQCSNRNALCVAWQRSGSLIAAGTEDSKVTVWKPNGSEFCTLDANYTRVEAVQFSPTDELLLSGDAHARLWDLQTEKEVACFKAESRVTGVCFAPDGKRAIAATTGQRLMLIDIVGREVISEVHGHKYAISGITACKNVAASCDEGGNIKFWEFGKLRNKGSIEDKGNWFKCIALSEPAEVVVCGDNNGNLKFFDYDGELLGSVAIGDSVNSVSFSPDGKTVAVGTQSSEAILVDAREYKVVKKFEGHDSKLTGVAFAPDGGAFVSVSYDKAARVWPLE